MANSKTVNVLLTIMPTLAKWFRENLWHPAGLVQLGAVGGSYLIAWLLAAKILQLLEKDIEKVKTHMRFVLSPAQFTIVLRYVFWLLLVWFFQVLTKKFAQPDELLRMTLSFIFALTVVRFASFYIKSAVPLQVFKADSSPVEKDGL